MMASASILTARPAAVNHLCRWVGPVAAAERHRQDDPGSLSWCRTDFAATPERFGSPAHAGEAVALRRADRFESLPVVGEAQDPRTGATAARDRGAGPCGG